MVIALCRLPNTSERPLRVAAAAERSRIKKLHNNNNNSTYTLHQTPPIKACVRTVINTSVSYCAYCARSTF